MASTEKRRPDAPKEQPLLKAPLKRLMRDKAVDAPIKKRVMAALNLSCQNIPQTSLGSRGGKKNKEANQDLSPGLKDTLAQFSLSSQCSLSGPAAFSSHHAQYKMVSAVSEGGVPVLVAPDSCTDLGLCCLEGEPISCFPVGGELRLCLPQLLNTVLRDFSLQQINSVCDQQYLYCSRCDATQLHVLKVLGILPPGTPSCGLITLTDAQRLCNTLLHGSHEGPGEEDCEESGGLWVEHQCLGKCLGLFVTRLYCSWDAPCIRCSQCRLLFCPERFVMHSHRQPDKRTCHWGFDSTKWSRYLQLAHRHLGSEDEEKLKQTLEDMKAKFQQDKRPTQLGDSAPAFLFHSRVLSSLKEEDVYTDAVCQSWKQVTVEHLDGERSEKPEDLELGHKSRDGSSEAAEMCRSHRKDDVVLELLQMYNAQHEKLQSTLHRQKQLEEELQDLRRGDAADRRHLHGELEAVQNEHAQRLGEVQQEQRKLKYRLEKLRTSCRCKELKTEPQQETVYTKQLSELRQRLDRAEEDREELQEELRRERDARERLERTISELKQEMKESVSDTQITDPSF